MKDTILKAIAIVMASGLAVQATPTPHRGAQGGISECSKRPRAIYFISNLGGNSVVALPVAVDGTLSQGTVTATGGDGMAGIDAATNGPALPDPLFSQSSVTIAGNNLFAVNAGSNTLSMFAINPQNPTQLSLVGEPVALPGEFPVTVAASTRNGLVCVGSGGALNGVSCSSFSQRGLGPMDDLRSFDLVQTTPPAGPLNTVSQLFFSIDESQLFSTVKGDPTVNNTGFFSVFPVEARTRRGGRASLARKDIRTANAETPVLFGSTLIPGTSNVFVTDASFGAAVLSVNATTNTASLIGKQAIEGQQATCWATISDVTGSAFVTDVAANRVVEMSLTDASIISQLDLSANGAPGLIDLRAAGNFVYALAPGNGTTPAAVTVLDVSGGQGTATQLQHFTIGMGVDKNSQGMAVFE